MMNHTRQLHNSYLIGALSPVNHTGLYQAKHNKMMSQAMKWYTKVISQARKTVHWQDELGQEKAH